MTEESEYILGTDRDELDRLRFQHQVWVRQAYAAWERAGFRQGDALIDLGCGPGFTSFELAHVVGPGGRVIARDKSPRFLDFVRSECDRLAYAHVEPSLGSIEDLELPAGELDGAYARWLFCWLPDPGAALARVARGVRSGGAIVLQDYLNWGAMKLMPPSAPFDRVVGACMRSWAEGDGTIDVADHVPELAHTAGLTVEYFQPVARVGAVGSLEWRWLTEFYETYLPKLVDGGLLDAGELDAYHREWSHRTAQGTSFCYTPTVADVVFRKP